MILKRDHRLFNYEEVFGKTTDFLPTLLLDTDIADIEPVGAVYCVPMTADKIKSVETGKKYDHPWLWTQIVQAGKASSGGCSPQDGFDLAIKGQRVVPTGEIETSLAYFQVDIGSGDFFTMTKSAIQLEYNKGNKRAVGVGTKWYAEWQDVTIMPVGKTQVSSHEWVITGWDEEHPDHFRIDSHQGYYKWISREAFNAAMDATYGSVALTIAQTSQEKIDFLKQTSYSLIQAILDWIYNQVQIIKANQKNMQNPIVNQPKEASQVTPHTVLIPAFCAAITTYEGDKASRHNPGAIRCPDNNKKVWNHLAVASDNNFCVFANDTDGMTALFESVTNVCKGISPTYNFQAMKQFSISSCADLTITQYFIIRDPSSDKNNPETYASWVCKKLNIPTTTKMKELL